MTFYQAYDLCHGTNDVEGDCYQRFGLSDGLRPHTNAFPGFVLFGCVPTRTLYRVFGGQAHKPGPAVGRCGWGVWAACDGGCPAGKQVFSRFCLDHCHQSHRQPGRTGSMPARTNKSFPGFVSHTAPLRPDDRQNRQDGGNRFPKNLTAVRAVRPLASLPEQTNLFPVLSRTLHLFRSRGCGACPFRPLEVRKPAFPATGHPTGKVKCFAKTALSVRDIADGHGHCATSGAMGGWVGLRRLDMASSRINNMITAAVTRSHNLQTLATLQVNPFGWFAAGLT